MLRTGFLMSALVAISLLSVACQPITPNEIETRPRTPAESLAVDASHAITREETMNADIPISDPLVKDAVADLAQQSGVSLSQIALISFEAVTWPDSSLGCPQPDMAYAQVLVDGARIRLQVGDQVYEYHSGGGRPPFLCENPTEPVPGSVVPITLP